MLKSFFNTITCIIALMCLTVSIAHAQIFTDGDIVHMKDTNGTLTDANLVEIANTSNSTTLDLFFRVTIDDDVATDTKINVTPLVPTNQTAPTPTFNYKTGNNQWAALQTSTNNGVVSIAYNVIEGIATAQSATTVEVRTRFTTVPAYRFQLELDTTSLNRVYFDCYPGAVSHAVYDVTNDGSINNADITAVAVAMINKSLTGDVSEDGRINYVDFDLVTFVVGQGATIAGNPSSNSAPVAVGTIPDQTVKATPVTVDVSSYFSDPDGDTLTYTAISADTGKATVSVSSATVTITRFAMEIVGTSKITVTATDPGGLSVTQTFTANVVQVNLAPVITVTIPDVEIGNSDTYGVYAHDHFSDPDGDTLTYTASTTDGAIASIGVGGVGNSTVYIYANALGTVKITVTVTDTGGLSATQTFTATVVPKGPTAVGTIPAQTVKVGAAAATVDVSSYFNEPDLQTLTYTVTSSDTTKATVSVSSATVTITPVAVGTATVTVTATDPDQLSATQTISVSVIAETSINQTALRADAIPGLSSEELSQLDALLTYDTVIFNELHNGSDDANDWLELRNVSGVDLLLNSWQLTVRTSSGTVLVPLPVGTIIPAGEVLLITNTEMATADVSGSSIVAEAFALPQADFTLILRSPTAFGDLAGNYFEDESGRPETAPALTVDTAWDRNMPIGFGYHAEAWVASTHQDGLGTPGYLPPVSHIDLNNDGIVNILDLVLVAGQVGQSAVNNPADVNSDGVVNVSDLTLVAAMIGTRISN